MLKLLYALGLFLVYILIAVGVGATILLLRVFSSDNTKEEDDLIRFVETAKKKLEALNRPR